MLPFSCEKYSLTTVIGGVFFVLVVVIITHFHFSGSDINLLLFVAVLWTSGATGCSLLFFHFEVACFMTSLLGRHLWLSDGYNGD